MDARALAGIWILLYSVLNVITSTSSVSLKHDNEFEKNKPTESFTPALPTERLETLASTDPIKDVFEPEGVPGGSRFYREADFIETTSGEPRVVTDIGSSPYEMNDSSQKYTVATTELLNVNKTVIPLPTTETYSPEPLESDKSERRIVKDKYEERQFTDKTRTGTTVGAVDYSENNDNTEPTANLNTAMDTVTSSIYWITPTESKKNIEPVKDQLVLGITKPKQSNITDISKVEKQLERVMILQPSKEDKNVWLKETVYNMVENTMLKRETEDYVIQLHRRYEDLPVVEADNSIWRKYSRAVVENFVLNFCRNYPHHTASEQWMARWYKEEYNGIYNRTLSYLQRKKGHSAIQFAAPVRRALDIYKAILDTPIGIVQSKCKLDMPHWLCLAEYIVHLEDVSETCENIWHHAHVHLMVLQSIRHAKGVKDPASEIIAELESRLLPLESNNDVDFLFNLIIQTLGDLAKRLKEPLLSLAALHSFIRDLQSEDRLKCFSIDDEEL